MTTEQRFALNLQISEFLAQADALRDHLRAFIDDSTGENVPDFIGDHIVAATENIGYARGEFVRALNKLDNAQTVPAA